MSVHIRITAAHFCASGTIGGDFAPIIAYMRDWTLPRITAYCAERGWALEVSQT